VIIDIAVALLILIAIANSSVACSIAGNNAVTRVFYSLGRARVFPKWLDHINPSTKTPDRAIYLEGVIAVGFGAEDFTADVGVARTREGAEVAHARAAVSLAAHAGRVEPLDGIYADFRDAAGLQADSRSARALGYTGKMLIHPAQIAPVHAVFAPSPAEVDHARRVVAAFEEAQARGEGIAVVDGAMVDRPVVLRAARILAIAGRG